MKTISLAISALLIGAAFAPPASAQAVYGPPGNPPFVMQGAGGAGGAGGGATGVAVAARAPCVIGGTPLDYRTRGANPPPLDPSRKVYQVNCTQPFEPQGKGNLCCG